MPYQQSGFQNKTEKLHRIPLCITIILLISGESSTQIQPKNLGGGFHSHGMEARPKLTLDVFLSTITIFFLIVSQLSLLVCLILTYVTLIPLIIRQFRAMLRINRGFILIKESACEVGRGLNQE